MSFSSGVFSLAAGNPVVTGTTISSTVENNTQSDIATGLSTCLLKDGTQVATAAIPFVTGVTTTSGTFAVFNTVATTINAFGAATTINMGVSTGQLKLSGGFNTDDASVAAHATTCDIWTGGNEITLTGAAVTFTALAAAPQAGAVRWVKQNAAHIWTDGATFQVQGNANYTAAADDWIRVEATTTTTFDVTIFKADGSTAGGRLPTGYIAGLTYSNNAGDATNDLDFAVGSARNATDVKDISLASAITKQSDAAWAVGTNAGMLDTGAVGPDSDYYLWAILRSDTGVVDVLSSLSSTAPSMPTSYDYKRLFGWFKRVAGVNVLFDTYEIEGGGIEMNWRAPTLDINLANTLTTSRRTDAVKVPLNFSVEAHLNVGMNDAASGFQVWICCPDQTDAAPSLTVAPLSNITRHDAGNSGWQIRVRTSSTGTIAARSTLATVDLYAVSTMGFKWSRR